MAILRDLPSTCVVWVGFRKNDHCFWPKKNQHFQANLEVALVDTSHEKFQDLYTAALTKELDLSALDYLIVSHTEPDHSGSWMIRVFCITFLNERVKVLFFVKENTKMGCGKTATPSPLKK